MVKIAKWGNSLGVRLPKHVAQMLKLKPGDVVFIRVDTNSRECVMVPAHKEEMDSRYFSPPMAKPAIDVSKGKKKAPSFIVCPAGW